MTDLQPDGPLTRSQETIVGQTLAREINEAHALALEHASAAVAYGIKVGKLLLEAKAALPHGQWLPWLREHVSFGERTAQSYMRIAHKLPPEIRNGAADLSLRKALQHVAGPQRISAEDKVEAELQAFVKRAAFRKSQEEAEQDDLLRIQLICATIHDFEITFHQLGICPGDEVVGFCSLCEAEREGRGDERLKHSREWLERFEERRT